MENDFEYNNNNASSDQMIADIQVNSPMEEPTRLPAQLGLNSSKMQVMKVRSLE